ncbi:MAG: hypothetical protein H0W30_07635 [Gemmatimonadaceae bacterium]|nr:hypothetical protein [Gemmatimonadaceae bacterium]
MSRAGTRHQGTGDRATGTAEQAAHSASPWSPVPGAWFLAPARTVPGMLRDRETLRRYAPFVIALVSMLVYANALANGYVLDDRGVLLGNPLVSSLSGVWKAFANSYWPLPNTGGQYRPLAIATFAIDWAISGGAAWWMHAANMLWHAAASVAVFMLASELLSPAVALVVGLGFGVHPVHVEAVANVVGRLEAMVAFFGVSALMAHRRGSRWAPVLFALALLSKESGIVVLGLCVAHDLLLVKRPAAGARTKGSTPQTLLRSGFATFAKRRTLYAWYAGITLVWAAALVAVFRGRSFSVPATTFLGASLSERLLTVATIVPHYVRLLLAPFDLSADYYPRVIELVSGVTPSVLLGFVLALALGIAVRRAWRPAPELAFALLWIPIALSPVSNVFFASGVSVAERTLYLPSVGALLALGWVMQYSVRRSMRSAIIVAAAVMLLFAIRTWTRTPVWHDDKTYILTLLRDHPESYRGHLVAGRVLASSGDLFGAARQYALARTLFRRDPSAFFEAASVEIMRNDLPRADLLLDSAFLVTPKSPAVNMLQADVRFARRNFSGAIKSAQYALSAAPDSMRAVVIIGLAARAIFDTALAETTYHAGVQRHPDAWELRAGYADVLLAKGDSAAALAEATLAVALSRREPMTIALRERASGRTP